MINSSISNPESFFLQSIRKYPSIFKNKTSVAEHPFLVIGNGYEWGKDGNISQGAYEGIDKETISVEDAIEAYWKKVEEFEARFDLGKVRSAKMIERRKIRHNKNIETIKNSENLLHKPFNHEELNHPDISSYSMIVNIPDNITDEWKKIVIEFFDKVMVPITEKFNEEYFNIVEEKINNLR